MRCKLQRSTRLRRRGHWRFVWCGVLLLWGDAARGTNLGPADNTKGPGTVSPAAAAPQAAAIALQAGWSASQKPPEQAAKSDATASDAAIERRDARDCDDDALPAVFNIQEALRLFEARGFELLVAEAAVQGAQGDLRRAGALQNPLLSGSIGHSGGHYHPSQCGGPGCSATAYNVSLSDSFAISDVLSGKRRLRQDVAQAALDAAKLHRDDAHRTLRMLLKNQYLAVAIDVANWRFSVEVQQSYAHTYDLFATRYAAGDISETDLVRMETAALESEQNVDAAEQQLRLDRVSLAFLLGVRGPTPPFEIDADWLEQLGHTAIIEAPEAHYIAIARQQRPDLQGQALQQQRAQAAIRLSLRSRVPDIGLNLLFQQEGDGETAIQPPTYSGGVSFAPPVFYQYQGEVQRAQADKTTQDVAYRRLEAQVVFDVAQAYAAMTAGHKRLGRMQSKLRARATRGLALVQLQYEKGAASLLDLLDAQRTFIAINQEYIGDLSAYWQAFFQLEGAVAMDLQQ